MSLDRCRQQIDFRALWTQLGLPDPWRLDKLTPGREVKMCSPFREDRNPSFSVFILDGKVFWKDHGTGDGGDDVKLIEMAKGLATKEAIKLYHEMAGVEWAKDGGAVSDGHRPPLQGKKFKTDEWKEIPKNKKKPKKPLGDPVAIYDYYAPNGTLAHQTLRYDPKTFRQRRPGGPGEGAYVWHLRDCPVYPYHLQELLAADRLAPVFLVEGEKDADNLRALEHGKHKVTATTLPMGAGKWRPEYAQWFRGRWVVIIADDDEPGRKGALAVAVELLDVAERVTVLQVPDLWEDAPEGADVSDWLENGWDAGVVVDDQWDRLMEVATKAEDFKKDFFVGAIYDGRGGAAVNENLFVRDLVASEGLIYCGDHFWKFVQSRGKWQKLREKTWIKRKARRVLQELGAERVITDSRINSIVSLARSERVKFPEDLNGHPAGTLPVINGLLDVESGKLYPHNPGHYITTQTPHVYDPAAKCPWWLEWIRDRHDDEETIAQIQEMFGYCLFLHINFHSFFFFFGEGGTGKSTCVDVLEWLVGSENKVSLELTELDNPFTRSQLVGRSLYLAKELTSRSLRHIGLIKAIVSGDPISVDVKYGEGYDFRPSGRLVMESNVVAATPDSSGGFERRFIQINWEKEFDRKKIVYGYQERFRDEMSGILNWAIEGYKRLVARGRFEHTVRSERATQDLLKHRSQVSSYLKEGWITETDDTRKVVEIDRVYELYQVWCAENDVVPFYEALNSFSRELFSRKAAWRDRKKRVWLDGVQARVLVGMEETRPDYGAAEYLTTD